MNSEAGDTTAKNRHASQLPCIPSVDEVLKTLRARAAIDRFGRPLVVAHERQRKQHRADLAVLRQQAGFEVSQIISLLQPGERNLPFARVG